MKKERNNTIITEYCYEKTNYNLYQSCLKEKVFSEDQFSKFVDCSKGEHPILYLLAEVEDYVWMEEQL